MEPPPEFGAQEDRTLTLGRSQGPAGRAPTRWRHLEIRETVGSGGFGSVYRAWDTVLQREVALKLLRVPDPAHALAEGRALARVRHPNIATVYGIDSDAGDVGLWIEFINGKTLADQLRLHGPLGAREASLIGLDVCRALSAVHAAGLLHRDIKADNVMREEGGRIVLTDFGISEVVRADRTRPATLSGTPPYMAPELFRGEAATPQSDVYAAGVLLYHLVSDCYPVESDSLRELAAALAAGQIVQLRDRRPDLPEAFLQVVEKATALDREARYSTAGELGNALATTLGEAGSAVAPEQRPRSRTTWLAIIAALAGIAGVGSYVALRHFRYSPGPEVTSDGRAYESYRKGRDLLDGPDREGNLDAAVKAFQATVEADPSFAIAYAGLGEAYWLKYRSTQNKAWLDLAEKNSRKALELNNQIGSVYGTLGRIHADAGQYDLAQQEFERGLTLDPRNSELLQGRAQCYEAMGRLVEAEATFAKAAAMRPNHWEGYSRLGSFYYRRGRYADALREYQHAVRLAPDNVGGLNNIGATLMAMGRWDEARTALERSLQVRATYSAVSNLGAVAQYRGRYGEAAALFEKALKLNDGNYVLWGNLASAYQWSGQEEKARHTYEESARRASESLKLKPSDPKIIADLSSYDAMLGRTEESLALAEQAMALAANDTEVLYRLGEAYEHLGRREDAIRSISRAVENGYAMRALQANPELKKLLEDPRFRDARK